MSKKKLRELKEMAHIMLRIVHILRISDILSFNKNVSFATNCWLEHYNS